MTHLKRRKGVYYFRIKHPSDVRRLINRTEFCISLRTTDRHSALVLCHTYSASALRLYGAVRQAGSMTSEEIDALISAHMEDVRANREDDWTSILELSPEDVKNRSAFARENLRQAQDALAYNRLESAEQQARRMIVDSGVTLGESDFRKVCYRLLALNVDAAREVVQRLPEVSPPALLEVKPDESPRLSALVTDYLAHRDVSAPLRPKTRIEAVAALKTLVDFLNDPPLASVRNRDAQDYARKLAGMPQRWRQAFKGKLASTVLKEVDGKELPRSAPATVNKEIALVKSFWRWSCEREELSRNAMDVIRPMDTGNAKDKRKPFTDDDIRRLAPLIEAMRTDRPDRYWVTTLLAYSGARLEEIAQLRKQDIFRAGDLWCIRISGAAGSVKNEASERELPIHSAVIAKGFLKFVDSAPDRLFTEEESAGRSGQPISKWFARQVNSLNLEDYERKSMHSFRHTMRDQLRLAKVDPVTRREILGHAHEDVEDQVYGSASSMQERSDALELVRLPL